MKTQGQHRIKQTIGSSENLPIVCRLAEETDDLNNHTELARRVCLEFNFKNEKGELQVSTCLTALHDLMESGELNLSKSSRQTPRNPEFKCSSDPLPLPEGLPKNADEVQGLKVVRVSTSEEHSQWSTIYKEYTPTKTHTVIGQTVKYLITWGGFVLGFILFGSARINSADRDFWIGWDKETRGLYLNCVRGMELYIRKGIDCQNLLQIVLRIIMDTFPKDCEEMYGYRPMLVETFLPISDDDAQNTYMRSRWEYAGPMKFNWDDQERSTSNEEIAFMWVIDPEFRDKMGIPSLDGLGSRDIIDGINDENWAQTEIGMNLYGDKRVAKSAVNALTVLSKKPGQNVCEISQGDHGEMRRIYGLIDNKRESVNSDNFLLQHNLQTYRRAKSFSDERIIFIQDTVVLNYGGLTKPEKRGLRIIGSNQTDTDVYGLKLHHVIVVTYNGIMLGEVFTKYVDAIDPDISGLPNWEKDPTEKESFKMIDALRQTSLYAKNLGIRNAVQCIDREGNYLYLFYIQREYNCMDLVVKATKNLKVHGTNKTIFEYMGEEKKGGEIKIKINHESARTNKSERDNKDEVSGREAICEVKFAKIRLNPPKKVENKEPIELNCVYVNEINAPEGVKKISFCLLTSLAVETLEDALEIIKIYRIRWVIEEFHRVLENTCEVENLRNDTAERIQRLIALYIIIAWRTMLLLQLSRFNSDFSSSVVFSKNDMEVLKVTNGIGNKTVETLGGAVKIIGKIGGYIDQKNGTRLGYEVFARGINIFSCYAEFYSKLLQEIPPEAAYVIHMCISEANIDFWNIIDDLKNNCNLRL